MAANPRGTSSAAELSPSGTPRPRAVADWDSQHLADLPCRLRGTACAHDLATPVVVAMAAVMVSDIIARAPPPQAGGGLQVVLGRGSGWFYWLWE